MIEACDQAVEQLGGDGAIGARLHQLRGSLQREASHEPRLADVDALLDSTAIQLDEALALLERIRDDLDLDPDALAEIERRLTRAGPGAQAPHPP